MTQQSNPKTQDLAKNVWMQRQQNESLRQPFQESGAIDTIGATGTINGS
jgi:hypothetical protein